MPMRLQLGKISSIVTEHEPDALRYNLILTVIQYLSFEKTRSTIKTLEHLLMRSDFGLLGTTLPNFQGLNFR